MSQNRLYQSFIEAAFEDMKPYQDETDDAYYFFEFPLINLQKFHDFCNCIGLKLEIAYFTREEIHLDDSKKFSPKLTKLFNKNLNKFVETYIENNEKPPVKGRYAILSIVTTPTNYRTLGLVGSYFKKHGEEWKCYRFPSVEPSKEEILQFDGKNNSQKRKAIID